MYYVYGILDPDAGQLPHDAPLSDVLGSVFYVGKGTGSRSGQHAREALALLNEELEDEQDEAGERSRTIAKLQEILTAGSWPRTIKLAAGFKQEQDAYRVEAFAIETVNAHRAALGKEPLTNAVKGHGTATEDLENYFNRLNTEHVTTPLNAERLSIVVKGQATQLTEPEFTLREASTDDEKFPEDVLEFVRFGINSTGDRVRRGWDPHQPWQEPEARARAVRYWSIAKEKVVSWIRDPESAPEYLMLAVPEPEGSVIRFIWRIDPYGVWERHEGKLWGIPVAEGLVEDHPYLNTVLHEAEEDGSRGRQVLQYRSKGIRVDRF